MQVLGDVVSCLILLNNCLKPKDIKLTNDIKLT